MNEDAIRLQARFEAIAADGAGDQREYQAVLVAAGRIRNADGSPGRYEVTADSIRNAVDSGMFEARAAFVDHAGALASPSLRDLFGVWHTTYYDEMRQAAVGTLRVFKTDATKPVVQLLDEIMATPERMRPDVGVSIVFYPETQPGANQHITRVTGFRSVESADVVFLPAVEASRILAALAAEPGDGVKLAATGDEPAVTTAQAEAIFVPEADGDGVIDTEAVEASANVTVTIEVSEKEDRAEGTEVTETDRPDDDGEDDVVMQTFPPIVIAGEAQPPADSPPVEAVAEVTEVAEAAIETEVQVAAEAVTEMTAPEARPEPDIEVASEGTTQSEPAAEAVPARVDLAEQATESPAEAQTEQPNSVPVPATETPTPEPVAQTEAEPVVAVEPEKPAPVPAIEPEPVPVEPVASPTVASTAEEPTTGATPVETPAPPPVVVEPEVETKAPPAAAVTGAGGGKIVTETVTPLPPVEAAPVVTDTPNNKIPQASNMDAPAIVEIQTDHEETTDMSEDIVKQAAAIEPNPQQVAPQQTVSQQPVAQTAPAFQPPAMPAVPAGASGEWLDALQQASAKAIIYSSGLPTIIQQRLARFTYNSPAEVEAAIEEAKAELATLHEGAIVQVGGQPPRGSIMVSDALDEAKENINWLLGVSKAKTPPANMRRFDQLYVALTGDVEFRGMFDATRVMFAGATTTTLPNIAADALNKVIMEQMVRMDHWRWFERVVSVEPNDGSLNDMKWITMGGLSNLPTVEEGSAYLSLSVDDAKETAAFVKRGGYVGITREMIRGSNIMQLQAIPRGLANAAIRTRSAAISSIFTANNGVGPTLLQDNKALFHLDHNNLATGALDTTNWRAARAEAFKHQELNSGASLGIYPRFLLVPAELYDTALSLLGYGEGMPTVYTPEAQDRGFADPRPIPLVVPDWADQNNWAYVVDPAVYPVIQMSYAQAQGGGFHPAPEVFAVVSETSGLMFTNDTLPIKVRDEFAVGVNGPRGIGKRNVAGG